MGRIVSIANQAPVRHRGSRELTCGIETVRGDFVAGGSRPNASRSDPTSWPVVEDRLQPIWIDHPLEPPCAVVVRELNGLAEGIGGAGQIPDAVVP